MPRIVYPTLADLQHVATTKGGGSTAQVDQHSVLAVGAAALTLTVTSTDHAVSVEVHTTLPGSARALTVNTYDYGKSAARTSIPAEVVQRLNALLRDEGVEVRRDWRTGGHDLRWGQALKAPLLAGGAVRLVAPGATGPGGWSGKSTAKRRTAGTLRTTRAASTVPAPATAAAAVPPLTASVATPSVGVAQAPAAKPAPAKRAAKPAQSDVIISKDMREAWAEARAMADDGDPCVLFLTGPTGTGKTTTVEALAEAEGLRLIKVNGDGKVEPAEWFGGMAQSVTDENGQRYYTFAPTEFWEALTSPEPSVVLVDEVNRASVQAAVALLPVFDYTGTVTVPQTGRSERVNKQVQIVCTANVGSEYSVGTQPLDPALSDRLEYRVPFDYLSETDEAGLMMTRFGHLGLQADQAAKVARCAAQIRQSAKSGLHAPLSTRLALRWAHAIAKGADPRRAAERAVLRHYSHEGGGSSEQAKVRTILSGVVW